MLRGVTCFTTCLLAMGDVAWAHSGHGTTSPDTVTHYVIEPVHALPILLVGAGILAARQLVRRNRSAALRRHDDPHA